MLLVGSNLVWCTVLIYLNPCERYKRHSSVEKFDSPDAFQQLILKSTTIEDKVAYETR